VCSSDLDDYARADLARMSALVYLHCSNDTH
jgi:hypothetical protein